MAEDRLLNNWVIDRSFFEIVTFRQRSEVRERIIHVDRYLAGEEAPTERITVQTRIDPLNYSV